MEKYTIQKAQKIVSALYLVTDLIKDNEILKWEIREESVAFMSNALMLHSTLPGEKEQTSHMLLLNIEKLISYLNIALISSVISKMNAEIIIREVESLRDFVNKNIQGIQLPGYILSDSFFQTDVTGLTLPLTKNRSSNLSKTFESNKENNDKIDIKDKKNNRQESILNLLKKDSHLTIKDFSKVITDCSEKTIQRELISLMEKGLIKKEGERRWSTYSLV